MFRGGGVHNLAMYKSQNSGLGSVNPPHFRQDSKFQTPAMYRLKALIVLSFCLLAGSMFAEPFTVTLVTNPPSGGTITGAGTYSNHASVTLQLRSTAGWYVQSVIFTGPPNYIDGNGGVHMNPQERFQQMLQYNSIVVPGFDPTTVTNFDAQLHVNGDSTTTVSFVPLRPTIAPQPTSVTLLTGTNVTFSSGASGRQPISYQWKKDGISVPGKTDGSLVLTNIQRTNTGIYTLIASNSFGVTDSIPASLVVRDLLVFNNGQPISESTLEADGQTTISIQAPYPNGHIFYTLDGSEPDFEANPYSAPVFISSNCTLRVIAYKSDFSQSVIAEPLAIIVHSVFYLNNSSPVGSFAYDPPSGPYRSNTLVTITAKSDNGWTFIEWQGTLRGTNPTNAIRMDGDKSVSALFGTTLNPTAVGGTVSVQPVFPLYPYGSIVRFVGVPAPGKYFHRWVLNGQMIEGNPYNVLIESPNFGISALFSSLQTNEFTVTAFSQGGGGVEVDRRKYTRGDVAIMVAYPDPGQQFLGWSGDASGTNSELSLPMNSNKTVTAHFSHFSTMEIGRDNGNIVLSVSGARGDVLQIETSTNLSEWEPLITVTNFFDAPMAFDLSTNAAVRMYRAVRP